MSSERVRRLLRACHTPTAGSTGRAALGLLVATSTVGFMISGIDTGASGLLSLRTLLALGVAVAVLAATTLLLERVLVVATRRFVPADLTTALVLATVAALGVCDALHHEVFGYHLDGLQLVHAAIALADGELEASPSAVAFGISAYLVSIVALFFALRMLELVKLPPALSRAHDSPLSRAAAIGLLVATIEMQPTAVGGSTAEEIHARLPWHPVASGTAGGQGLAAALRNRGTMDEGVEEAQWRHLLERLAPLKEVGLAAERKPNILLISVESLRHDALTPERMPKLFERTRGWLTTPAHFTTGANTGAGLFGLLSGLHPYYYPPARRERGPLFPMVALGVLGYARSVWWSRNLDFDGLDEVLFQDAFDDTHDGKSGQFDPAEDATLVAQFLDDHDRAQDRPRFDLFVLHTTHYDYYYPPEYALHQPVAEGALYKRLRADEDLSAHRQGMWNRFLNSVAYADALLAELLDGLERRGRLHDTVVVIVGDHGEEFWENGMFGHTRGTSAQQVQVAFRMQLPGTTAIDYGYSSHADVFPTLFSHMGLGVDLGAFMTGKPLQHLDAGRDFAITGAGVLGEQRLASFTIVGGGYKVTFPSSGPLLPQRVHDLEDVDVGGSDSGVVADLLAAARRAKALPEPEGTATESPTFDPGAEIARLDRSSLVQRSLDEERTVLDLLVVPEQWAQAGARRGPVADARLTTSAWTLSTLVRAGKGKGDGKRAEKPYSLLRFGAGGDIGVGGGRRHRRYRVEYERLQLLGEDGQVSAMFVYDVEHDLFVGRDKVLGVCVLRRESEVRKLPKALWAKDTPEGTVTATELTDRSWSAEELDKKIRVRSSDLVTFVEDGTVKREGGSRLALWEVIEGTLHVHEPDGTLYARYRFDPAGPRLVGALDDGGFSELRPRRPRTAEELAAALGTTEPAEVAITTAGIQDRLWLRAHDDREGEKPVPIELLSEGAIGVGRSIDADRWEVVDGRLQLVDSTSAVGGWFVRPAPGPALRGLGADGRTLTLVPLTALGSHAGQVTRSELLARKTLECRPSDGAEVVKLSLLEDGTFAGKRRLPYTYWTVLRGRLLLGRAAGDRVAVLDARGETLEGGEVLYARPDARPADAGLRHTCR